LHAVSTLDCPDSQGDLTRKSAATDGKTCVYATDGGDQVTLQLVSLDGGDARSAMAPIEARLKTEVPVVTDAPKLPSPPGGGWGDDDKDVTVKDHSHGDHDRVDIDLPGIHIHSSGDGHANVDAAGVHVHANDGDHDHHDHGEGHADVRIGDGHDGVTINAGDGGAQIRVDEGGSGIRARYILASDNAGPHGYKVAGYEARGPSGGPIVVATLLSKSDDHDALKDDIRDLLKHTVGG
jgi:hypothetical protein